MNPTTKWINLTSNLQTVLYHISNCEYQSARRRGGIDVREDVVVNIFAEFAFKETHRAQLHALQQWLPCKWTVRLPFSMQIGFRLRMIMRIVSTQIKIATTRISATKWLLVLPEIAQGDFASLSPSLSIAISRSPAKGIQRLKASNLHIQCIVSFWYIKSEAMRENRAAASFKPER